MSDIQINRHNFEIAKNRIQELSNKIPKKAELPQLKTSYLWGLIDKVVTGAEMNEITKAINSSFVDYNDQILNIKKEFSEVYKAFEALENEYIQGLIVAVDQASKASKKAKEASEKAISAQSDIDKTIKALVITVSKLKEIERFFVENPEDVLQMRDIGKMQKDLQQQQTDISKVFIDISNISETVQKAHLSFQNEINALQEYRFQLEKYRHLPDIDSIWEKVEYHQQEIKDLSKGIGAHNKQLIYLEAEQSQTNSNLLNLKEDTKQSFEKTYSQIKNAQSQIESKSELFEKRLRIAYWVAGGALFLALLQFVLLMFKVL